MSISIKIQNLYKEYRLGIIGSGTLYRDLQSFWAKINNKPDPNSIINATNNSSNKGRRFLALKGINLEIEKGVVVGLIGPNGAGKSTLLKIISRITSPTKGTISFNGRIASLLEVGTGFHPELTGRENIYLNASINGMTISETDEKINDIVEFSGVGVHLDTPVKRYSSGMIVRLGFSVAAFLDPDILLIDEVLAVGDASFRDKAIKKIKQITMNKNKTIIFVSHNLESITQLCSKTILLNNGKVIQYDDTKKVIENYLNLNNIIDNNYSGKKTFKSADYKSAYIKSIASKDKNNEIQSNFKISENFILEVEYEVKEENSYALCLELYDLKDNLLIVAFDDSIKSNWNNQKKKKKGLYKTNFNFTKNFFQPGSIRITINISTPPLPSNSIIDSQIKNFSFTLEEDIDNFQSSRGHYPYFWGNPLIRPKIEANTIFLD